ncbi:MAG: hypothetical protein H6718_04185 [Polyangiaceae bacterium]|nr:hypothetical protein [Polyangiaceae bacterium]
MASTPFFVGIDPADLAQRSSYDPREEIADHIDGVVEPTTDDVFEGFSPGDYESKIEPLLDRLPEREADIVQLYFQLGKKQSEIAGVFGITQAAVSYRLQRAVRRLKFYVDMPTFDPQELRADLMTVIPETPIVDVLVSIADTSCQSATAEELRVTQGSVRARLMTGTRRLKKIAKTNPQFEPHAKLFGGLVDQKLWNILRAVSLPQWHDPEYQKTHEWDGVSGYQKPRDGITLKKGKSRPK